jgi:hypothetical protein
LNDAGATDILVVNLADVGLLPVAGSCAAFDSFASVGANAALNELIAPDQDNDELPLGEVQGKREISRFWFSDRYSSAPQPGLCRCGKRRLLSTSA